MDKNAAVTWGCAPELEGHITSRLMATSAHLRAEEGTPECIRKEIIRYFSDPEIKESCIGNIRIEKERLSWKTFTVNLEKFIETL